jgi:hypothetical protein
MIVTRVMLHLLLYSEKGQNFVLSGLSGEGADEAALAGFSAGRHQELRLEPMEFAVPPRIRNTEQTEQSYTLNHMLKRSVERRGGLSGNNGGWVAGVRVSGDL